MQKQVPLSQLLLPRNIKNEKTTLQEAKKKVFTSNHYLIDLGKSNSSLFQFSMELEPQLPADSSYLLDNIVKAIIPDLKRQIGYVTHKGMMIWGSRDAQIAKTFQAQFTKKETQYKFEVMLKPVKELPLKDFMKQEPQKLAAVCQVLNINTKNQLKSLNMVELNPGKFYQKNTMNKNSVKCAKLTVWRGYKVCVVPINMKLYLQIDICCRVLREETFLQTLLAPKQKQDQEKYEKYEKQEKSPSEKAKQFIGMPIVMRYGNNKIYHIEEINFNLNPTKTFYHEKEKGEISYMDYYKKNYNITIKDKTQPLVKVITEKSKIYNQGQAIQVIKYGYMIPELFSLTGMSDAQISNHKVMQEVAIYTKLTADQRVYQSQEIIGKLKQCKDLLYQIKDEPQAFTGYQMHQPSILVGGRKRLEVRNGSINIREKIKDPAHIKNSLFIHSVGRNKDEDIDHSNFAIDNLMLASKTFEILYEEPIILEVEGNKPENWTEKIKRYINNNSAPSIIVLFFTPKEESFYKNLKKFITNEYNIPSQAIRRRTLSEKQKGVLSCASKILLQMNAKLGHSLWQIPRSHPFWKEKKIAIGGVALSKGRNGGRISFVGTVSNDLSNIFADCKAIQSQNDLSTKFFSDLYLVWMRKFFDCNKKSLPDVIILYRQGLNDVQARQSLEAEITGLKAALDTASKKAKINNYQPKIQYMLVNKKVNTRMYEQQRRGGKCTYHNPSSGSVVFQELSTDNYIQFFLASVNVNQGTCTPVQFKVGYEEGKVPRDALAELTYEQCFNYPNWNGAVRVPGVLQCANKMAKLFSEHIQGGLKTIKKEAGKNEEKIDIRDTMFFL